MNKIELRKKIIKLRKKNNFQNIQIDHKKIFKFFKDQKIKKKNIGGYYPVNYELDDLNILRILKKKKFNISLPVIKKNYEMNFYEWLNKDPLVINMHGIPEPKIKKIKYPEVIFVPLVGYDQNLNRLGYGGGFYDRYINKIKKKKKIITIGLAFSFQKVKKIPINFYDQKLDYIITERDILK